MLITTMVRGWKKISKNKNNNKKLTHQQSLTPRTNSYKTEAVIRPKKSSKDQKKLERSAEDCEKAATSMIPPLPPLERDASASDGWEEMPSTSKAAAAGGGEAPPPPPPPEPSGTGAWKRIEKPVPAEEPLILSAKRNRAMRKRTSNWVKMASTPAVEVPLPVVTVVEPSSSKCRPGTLYSDVLVAGGPPNRLTAAAQRGVGDQLEVAADDNISVGGGGALVASNLGFFPSLNALNKKSKASQQQISEPADQRGEDDEAEGSAEPRPAEADIVHLQMDSLSLDSSLSPSGGLTDYEYFSAETDNDGWLTSSGEVEVEDSEYDSKSSDDSSCSTNCQFEVVPGDVAALVAKGLPAAIGVGIDGNNNEANVEGDRLEVGYGAVEAQVHVEAAHYAANVGQVVELGYADVVFGADVLANEANTTPTAAYACKLIADANISSYFSTPNEPDPDPQPHSLSDDNMLERDPREVRISEHVTLDIHPWNFLQLSDSSFIDFPRLLMQFSDPNYLRLEHQAMLGIKLAMGNMANGGMPKY